MNQSGTMADIEKLRALLVAAREVLDKWPDSEWEHNEYGWIYRSTVVNDWLAPLADAVEALNRV